MLNGLDLFSGIGGNTLGLDGYVRTVAYCEQDRHAQSVLLSRMLDGSIKPAPIWDDITTLSGAILPPIDIIVGGFPCQDISVAGKGAGLEGERSGLFFEVCRLIAETKPSFVFLENVPAIRARGGERVGKELASLGYDCRWDVVSAAEVGAPHKRERWFLLAYANGEGLSQSRPSGEQELRAEESGGLDDRLKFSGGWEVEPNVGRVVDGVPLRVDRIKRLGNAVVPAQAREAFERLMGIA